MLSWEWPRISRITMKSTFTARRIPAGPQREFLDMLTGTVYCGPGNVGAQGMYCVPLPENMLELFSLERDLYYSGEQCASSDDTTSTGGGDKQQSYFAPPNDVSGFVGAKRVRSLS